METIHCHSIKQRRPSPSVWRHISWLLLLLVLAFGAGVAFGECPHLCECKWKSGKESVVCLNANLSGIPTKLDAGTQILDLTRNDIPVIANDAFDRANLLNLQKLFIAKCHLRTIERYAFRNLINLVELDLSDNAMVSVPSHAFEATPELRELRLNGNPIQRIYNDAFVRVPQLTRLELADCKLATIDVRAFVALESSLEWLKLNGNRLTDVRAGALMRLQNLHGLELANNLWNCSCVLRPLREWMLHENIPYDIPPVCRYPDRLQGKAWDKIDLDEYACVPHILASDVRAHGVEGKNVTMSCVVGGVPEPNVRWIVRNRVIANLTGNANLPTTQGRKLYVANLQHNASKLTILTADVQDAGTYICAAENKAGKVEASVTLAVSRKPAEAFMSAKVILASVIAIALFVLTTSLGVICVCTLRRRNKLMRWHTQSGRCDSYEKIELNNCKPNNHLHHLHQPSHGIKSPRSGIDRSAYQKSCAENGISVVGQTCRRNGAYRKVPSEDDGTGYEDNIETGNATISNINIETLRNWTEAKNPSPKPNNNRWPVDMNAKTEKSPKLKSKNEIDLHIPRLIEFSDGTPPDSACNISLQQYDTPKRPMNPQPTTASGGAYTKSTWSQHINRKRMAINTELNYGGSGIGGGKERTTSDSDCDSDKKYPDLLDISSLSTTTTAPPSANNPMHVSMHATSTATPSFMSMANNQFCTFPRKKHNVTRTQRNKMPIQSDSQSPLLPESSSSRYSSSTFTENNDFMSMGRRLSSDSFTNYPLSMYASRGHPSAIDANHHLHQHHHANGRSNSFLNLANGPVSNHKRNPSLPSSPARDAQAKMLSSDETPLLDFSSLTSRNKQQLIATPSPSTSSTTAATAAAATSAVTAAAIAAGANPYDYHAAQLERFLEEYRNLQEQLCKMKETCDSIRKKEAPLRATAGNSAKLADPVMYTAAALPTPMPMADAACAVNPKSILKAKALLPGQPPDPPPYWLHRSAMLKRLHDPGTDFFQS